MILYGSDLIIYFKNTVEYHRPVSGQDEAYNVHPRGSTFGVHRWDFHVILIIPKNSKQEKN